VLRKKREPATPAVPEVVSNGIKPDEMAATYERNISDATALVFAHLTNHAEDAGLDPDRNGTTAPTLYQAVCTTYPHVRNLGLTPTMWARAVSVALNAVRDQDLSLAHLSLAALAATTAPPPAATTAPRAASGPPPGPDAPRPRTTRAPGRPAAGQP
jgi:hypothetical protein